MTPSFDPETGNLPPGVHEATWIEIVEHYGYTVHRRWLLGGLRELLDNLEAAGCTRVYIDGSFVSEKEKPGDFDGCWELAGVDHALLDPSLLDISPPRIRQKERFLGEMFPVDSRRGGQWIAMLEFFQSDKVTHAPKGIISLRLEDHQ